MCVCVWEQVRISVSVCESKYECVSVCDCTHGYLVQGGGTG